MKIQKISGKIITGNKIGKTIGFPTINIRIGKTHIKSGVYKVNSVIEGKMLNGAGCLLEKKGVFETHIFDFNKDIYGKDAEIILLKYIRKNKKFGSLNKLKSQIKKDIKEIKKIKIKVITFGTFDILHKGHEYYLNEAKKYGDKLYTVISRDLTTENIKGKKVKNNENIRLEKLKKLGISDKVILGNKKNFLSCLKKIKPNVICLGYDQNSYKLFKLKEYLKENNLEIETIKIGSFHPEIYKSSKM